MQMLSEFTNSCEFLTNFLGGGPPNPSPGEVNHLYHLTALYLDALHAPRSDVLCLVCPPFPLTSGSGTVTLPLSPICPPPRNGSRIALSATLKDLSATSKSRENTGIQDGGLRQVASWRRGSHSDADDGKDTVARGASVSLGFHLNSTYVQGTRIALTHF